MKVVSKLSSNGQFTNALRTLVKKTKICSSTYEEIFTCQELEAPNIQNGKVHIFLTNFCFILRVS